MEMNIADKKLKKWGTFNMQHSTFNAQRALHRAAQNRLGVGVLVATLLLITLAGCKPKAQTPGSSGGRSGGGLGPTTISTATANQGSIGVYVNALGIVTPLKTVSINGRVQGQIVAVKYQEGQMVKAGDPLIEIDPGPNQAALTQAQGQLKRDTAILADAKIDLERYQEAYASNAIPKQQLDTQAATVQQDEGTVLLDGGLLTNAQVQLAYCHITSPISGRVGLRLVDEGNMVQANGTTPLVVIAQLQPITVIFNVAEDDLPPILEQVRANKTLTVDAFDRAQVKKLASGTLETLDNQVDPTSGTVKFRAIFTNDDLALFPNQFVNARLLVKTLEGATLLTNSAIQRNSEGAYVYLVKQDPPRQTNAMAPSAEAGSQPAANPAAGAGQTNSMHGAGQRNYPSGTVTMQTITTGTTDGSVTAVEGIEPGAVVAADSFNKLTDGARVLIRPGGASGGRGGAGAGGAAGHHQHNPQQQPQGQQHQTE
jgi:multidrug efflux system membrane fusion protein